MIKKGITSLSVIALAVLLGTAVPMGHVYATENDEVAEVQTEKQTETETEIPESYYLPIESNNVKGWPAGPQVEAEAAVLLDAETGTFLYSKNAEAKEYPASITKIMTTLVAIENGNLDSKVKFSSEAVDTLDPESSRLWMEVGEKITLRQALYGVMLASANDCANGVAEKVAGSIDEFVQMMNDKAAELGCVNTHFTNTHGLHDEDHYTCARDMAIIMKAAMENSTFAEINRTIEYYYPETNKMDEERYFINHHKMLWDEDFYYEGCIGGKTGFTSDALNTLVTVANRDKRTLICVVLRTNGAAKTFTESTALLDYGFENFKNKNIRNDEAGITRANLLGVTCLGEAGQLVPEILNEPAVLVAEKAKVTIPKGSSKTEVVKRFSADGEFAYTYNDWKVGSTPVTFQTIDFEIPEQKIINMPKVTETESELETASDADVGIAVQAGEVLQSGLSGAKTFWDKAVKWVYANDVMMAVVGLILILALLPILIIAFARSRKASLIRKQRKLEREEMVQREETIESKSALEIEAEIRAELEKEKAKKEREEARKREAEKAEQEIKELEEVIDGKAPEAAEQEQDGKEIEKEDLEDELGSTDQG